MKTRFSTRISKRMTKFERMWKHIYRSALARLAGKRRKNKQRLRASDVVAAAQIASATVNKARAAAGKVVSKVGRRGWYPGRGESVLTPRRGRGGRWAAAGSGALAVY